MGDDEPLDFESEDLLLTPVANKKRKKVIGLDDLLTDYYKEKSKIIENESKRAKTKKSYSSDEDEDIEEAELSRCVEECRKEMGQISCDDEISLWGLHVFGNQKPPPRLAFPDIGNFQLLCSFMNNDLNSLVELDSAKGELFLEKLLVNGWLLKLVSTGGHVEKSLAMWTFNLMLYSSKEELRTSACDFWCALLSSTNEVDILPFKMDWLPNYSEIKGALEIYGFLSDISSNTEVVHEDSDCGGPPQNIRAWIKYVDACCKVRTTCLIFSTSEAEELVTVIICLFLDRQLLGLSVILHNCLLSVIGFFTDDEWHASCENVAKSLACRVPCDINCLRTVESISGVDTRSKQLRSTVAFQILVTCLNKKVGGETEEILRQLISFNVKDKNCDLFKMYIYLVLTEKWLLYNPILENKPVIYEMWGVFLRNCSCQIGSTDLRAHASKVRSKASYILQGSANK